MATEAQKSEFKKAFSKFDKNCDGHISSSELAEVMKGLSVSMTDQQVQDMLKEVDSDNNGSIEFDEFCSYMLNKLNKAKQPPNLDELRKRTFAACDRDGSGKVGADELVDIMKLLGDSTITLQQAQELVSKYDADGDSQISYEEFVALLSSK